MRPPFKNQTLTFYMCRYSHHTRASGWHNSHQHGATPQPALGSQACGRECCSAVYSSLCIRPAPAEAHSILCGHVSACHAPFRQALGARVFLAKQPDTRSTWGITGYSLLSPPSSAPAFLPPSAVQLESWGPSPLPPGCWRCRGTACPGPRPGWAR